MAVTFALLVLAMTAAVTPLTQARRDFAVSARKYAFAVEGASVPEIRVQQDDLVRITFSVQDIPHSFTIDDDHYRISRLAKPGHPVTFDFRADRAGSFPITCALTIDERCREMKALLIVEVKR